MTDERSTGYELLTHVRALAIEVIATETDVFGENIRLRITMRDDPELLSECAFGLIFALSVLSYADARPRGISELGGYDERDEFTVGDLLRGLRFERGRLCFYADYVRGRMLKTKIEVAADGTAVLETQNRGEAATRWVARLQGKPLLTLISDMDAAPNDE